VRPDKARALVDLNSRESVPQALLAAAVLWMGVYPKPFTDTMHSSVSALLKHVQVSKIPAAN
jgi:NADH-quinone oxidoreductase subunit M